MADIWRQWLIKSTTPRVQSGLFREEFAHLFARLHLMAAMDPEMQLETRSAVSAIIVTYNPGFAALRLLLDAIIPQVEQVFIIDNGSTADIAAWLVEQDIQVDLVRLGDNFGIAKAQNRGIAEARARGATFILLLDQDSLPAPDMVAKLLSAARTKITNGVKLACVGPRYSDVRQNNPPPFIRTRGLRLERQACTRADAVVDVDYLIASGCLIPMSALDDVGGMREELFIDYVDIEWGLRAQQKGYSSFGVCAALMRHDLGDEPVLFRGRQIPVHSPIRHYYHFRNAIWLYRQPWLRLNWKVIDGSRLLLKFVFYSLMTVPRLQHAKMMTMGVFHGFIGKMGKKAGNA